MKYVLCSWLLVFAGAVLSEEFQLELKGDTYTFKPYTEIGGDYHFGAYRLVMALTGGNITHLYPDGTYAVEEFCDICESSVLSHGKYHIENFKVVFEGITESLNLYYGRIYKPQYVTGFEVILVNDSQLELLKKDNYSVEYQKQIRAYPDWRNRKRELLQGNH